jgi:hypothetical protein
MNNLPTHGEKKKRAKNEKKVDKNIKKKKDTGISVVVHDALPQCHWQIAEPNKMAGA